MPLFARAQPPALIQPPFGAPSTDANGRPPSPPTGMAPPIPSAKGVGHEARALHRPDGQPLVPPPPPPPPREEDAQFVRRIQYTYYDRVIQEAQKWDLLEDQEDLSIQTPGWVYDTMTIMPYLGCCTFTVTAVFVVLQYGVKFQTWQEDLWLKGSLFGFLAVLTLLELLRIVMLTLVELRMYENRKKAKAGAFLPRRTGEDAGRQLAPPPRLWKAGAPSLPKAGAFLPASRSHPFNTLKKAHGGAGDGTSFGEMSVALALAPPPPPPPPPKFHGASLGPPLGMSAMAKLPPLGPPPDWTQGAPPRTPSGTGRFGDTLRIPTPTGDNSGGSPSSSRQNSLLGQNISRGTGNLSPLPRPSGSSSAAAKSAETPLSDVAPEKESELHEK